MGLQLLEEMAREQEEKLDNRFVRGYLSGLKSAVLVARRGESLQDDMDYIRHLINIHKDPFDLGMLDGYEKAQLILERT